MTKFTSFLFYPYLALLFWLPIPLGSNRPLWWSLAALMAGVLLLVWAVGRGFGYGYIPRPLRRARWPLLVLVLFNCWLAFKLLPAGVLPALLESDLVRQAYIDAVGSVPWLVVDWHAGAETLLRSLGLLSLAVLTILLVRTQRRVEQVLGVLMLAGLVQAMYGSMMTLTGVEFGFFEAKTWSRGLASGTYINRNHYANMLVLSLAAGIGLLICRMGFNEKESWRARLLSFLITLMSSKVPIRVFLAIIVVALVLTHSRMGNTSFFVALLLVGFGSILLMRRFHGPLFVLVASLLVIDIFLVGTWFGLEQVVERIQQTVQMDQDQWVLNDGNRRDVSRETGIIIHTAGPAGIGGGSFYTVYPAWRTGDQKFMDHAHNDYLQLLLEYGLPGFALLGVFMLLVLGQVIRRLHQPDDVEGFGVAFATGIAVSAMLIHISVEFNLQIYANAAWFVVLCMLPWCRPRTYAHVASMSANSDTSL